MLARSLGTGLMSATSLVVSQTLRMWSFFARYVLWGLQGLLDRVVANLLRVFQSGRQPRLVASAGYLEWRSFDFAKDSTLPA